jgi:uncharacterized protein YcbX
MRSQQGTIHQLRIYPIKALCPIVVKELVLSPTEGIRHDREWALMDKNDLYINGKSCPRVHDIRLNAFSPPSKVTLQNLKEPENEVTFDLYRQKDLAENWFKTVIGKDLKLVHKSDGCVGFFDDPRFTGPTIVSLNTLKTVEEWMGVNDAADRFRPNIIVDGVDAFWEDLLFDEDTSKGYKITIGSIDLVAVYPVHRCVVPTRAPSTSPDHGKSTPEFIQKFQALRTNNFVKNAPQKRLTSEKTFSAYHLCTACVILMPGSISVRQSVTVKEHLQLQSAVEKAQPLTKQYIRQVIDHAHSIRGISHNKHRILSMLVTILPVALSAKIITSSLPDSVRKPTLKEILFGLLQIFIILLILWYFVSYLLN